MIISLNAAIKLVSPVSAMMREIEGLRLQDRQVVAESYKEELSKIEEKRKLTQDQQQRNLSEVARQELQYASNTELVENALEDLDRGIVLPIKVIKDSNNQQTWELFCKSFPLHRAIVNGKLRPVQVLLNPKESKFYIDYMEKSSEYPPAYEMALSLRRNLTSAQVEIRNAMIDRILKDLPKFSEDGQLQWFLQAVIIQPKLNLINAPIPTQDGRTAAMQLAKDNNMAALITIDADLNEYEDCNIRFNIVDNSGKTMLDYALENGHKELSLWLLEKSELELSSIEQVCINGNLAEVERLLAINDGSVDPTIRSNAPLLWAIMHNQHEIVTKLIADNRIDIKANDNIAIITAVRYGHLAIARQLVEAGADITAQDDLALKFATALEPKTRESRDTKQAMLDFVFNARLHNPVFISKKQNQSAIDIQYLWKNHKIKNNEAQERDQFIEMANSSKEEAVVKEKQRELEIFYQTRPLSVANTEEAQRLSREQQIYLVNNSMDWSSLVLVTQINQSLSSCLCRAGAILGL